MEIGAMGAFIFGLFFGGCAGAIVTGLLKASAHRERCAGCAWFEEYWEREKKKYQIPNIQN